MAEKSSKKIAGEKIEREYTIPLREKCRPVPRYKKTNKAVKTVKEFLVRHMKIRDRDLNKIKIDTYLNEYLWGRGIKNPPHKVKVKAVKEAGQEIVRVELAEEFPKKFKAKKSKLEKIEAKAQKITAKKPKPSEKVEEKSEKEEEEKKEMTIEEGQKMAKEKAKKAKHTTKVISPEQEHRGEKNLAY